MTKYDKQRVIRAIQYRMNYMIRQTGRQFTQYIDHYQAPKVDLKNALVITGFWRSGTTWLMSSVSQMIGFKTVFEPLDLQVFKNLKSHPYQPVLFDTSYDDEYLHCFIPFAETDFSAYTELDDFIERSLRAELSNRWVQKGRVNYRDALLTNVVLKLVRGQFCIGAMDQVFGVPIIHIYRDPRAVTASIIRKDWGHWLYNISLKDNLLTVPDGRANYFEQFSDLIETYENADHISRITAYWCLTERYVQYCSTKYNTPIIVSYNTLISCGIEGLKDTLHALKITSEFNTVADVPSETTYGARREIVQTKRQASWQSELSLENIKKIETIVTQFNLEERLDSID